MSFGLLNSGAVSQVGSDALIGPLLMLRHTGAPSLGMGWRTGGRGANLCDTATLLRDTGWNNIIRHRQSAPRIWYRVQCNLVNALWMWYGVQCNLVTALWMWYGVQCNLVNALWMWYGVQCNLVNALWMWYGVQCYLVNALLATTS